MPRLIEEVMDWVYGGFRPCPLSMSNSRFCWALSAKAETADNSCRVPWSLDGLPLVPCWRYGPLVTLDLQIEK